MLFLNEYDVQATGNVLADLDDVPNLQRAHDDLVNLVEWTNGNSDGWHAWPKPARAAARLMATLKLAERDYYAGHPVADITPATLRNLRTPIRAMLTRTGNKDAAMEIFR